MALLMCTELNAYSSLWHKVISLAWSLVCIIRPQTDPNVHSEGEVLEDSRAAAGSDTILKLMLVALPPLGPAWLHCAIVFSPGVFQLAVSVLPSGAPHTQPFLPPWEEMLPGVPGDFL